MAALTPLARAKRIVVKIGSAQIADMERGGLRKDRFTAIATDCAAFIRAGGEVLIVSSGAVAAGRDALGWSRADARRLEQKQAAAAAGQPRLAAAWARAFEPFGLITAQALLTLGDTEERRRWLNARATLETLLAAGAAPVINENDTVATEELRYGDNDRLAARVAQMMSAEALVLLSDVDGLYSADPRLDPKAVKLERIDAITPQIEALAGGARHGSGGMASKVEAAKIATAAGCATVIADGGAPGPLERLRAEGTGTWFTAHATPKAARRAWLAGMLRPKGKLIVDAGAARAVAQGSSLLPAGVVRVEGQFQRGDAVAVCGPDGAALAVGVTAYGDADARAIAGLKSSEIEAKLGYAGRPALVHRDDLVLNSQPNA